MNARNLISLFCLLLLSLGATSQTQFTRAIGGGSYDFGVGVEETSNGYLLAGYSSSWDFDVSTQILIMGINDEGFGQWTKTYGGQFSEVATDFVKSPVADEYLISGFVETTQNSYQALAMKCDANGDTIWTKSYGGSQWDFCNAAIGLSDGGFALAGQTYSQGNGNGDFYLIRINSGGDTLWTKTYGGAEADEANSVAVTADGGFILAGNTESYGAGGVDMYVVRTDLNGDTLWTRTYGGVEDDICNAVAVMASGDFVIVGGSFNFTPGKSDFVLRREEESGTNVWVKTDSRPGDNFLTDLIIEPSTQYVTVTGYLTDGAFGGVDGRMLRYGPGGTWNGMARTHGTLQFDQFHDIELTSDGGYVIVGTTQGYYERFDDIWVVKTDFDGVTSPIELSVDEVELNGQTYEVVVSPNPTVDYSTLTIIGFDELQKSGNQRLNLNVYNSLGELVFQQEILASETQIETSSFSPGIFHYQLLSGNSLFSKGKIIKLK